MSFEKNIADIKKLYSIISGKEEVDIILTYKSGLGITKKWQLRIDGREVTHSDYQEASYLLLENLKQELSKKISDLEQTTINYKKLLTTLN